jgi:hypothetical protein
MRAVLLTSVDILQAGLPHRGRRMVMDVDARVYTRAYWSAPLK